MVHWVITNPDWPSGDLPHRERCGGCDGCEGEMTAEQRVMEEARYRYFNNPTHHAKVHTAVQLVVWQRLNETGSRLDDADRSLAKLAASLALVVDDMP